MLFWRVHDTEGYIANSMARRAKGVLQTRKHFRDGYAKAFARALLNENCKGGKALTDETRAVARRSSLSATSLSLKGPRCRLLPSTSVVGNRHVPVAALQTRCKPGLPVWSKSGQAEVRDLPTDNVRFGSLADISERIRDVRFTPDSGHAERKHRRPLCAISGSWGQNVHQAAQLAGLHSGRASSISIRDIE